MTSKQFISHKFRVKDATTREHLRRHAYACNFVWNYCCEIQREAERRHKAGLNIRWPTAFDLINLTAGTSKLLGINADTICSICRQFAVSRDVKRRCPRFRASGGPKRSLGWLPFKGRDVQIFGDAITYRKRKFRFWHTRDIPLDGLKVGAFVEDARGRWYVVFQCEVANDLPTGNGEVGIDLGLKTLATLSDGSTVAALRHYRKYQSALAVQQRAGNKRRVRAIHAKIANARKHQLHEATTRIARENALIVVGNVSSAKLAKTTMAQSVMDAGWYMLKSQLAYKARRHGARFIEVDERWTTQTCSRCGEIPDSSPKGMCALGMRHWTCSGCGSSHDRDVNAARNILRVGLERQAPAEEIPAIQGREDVNTSRREGAAR